MNFGQFITTWSLIKENFGPQLPPGIREFSMPLPSTRIDENQTITMRVEDYEAIRFYLGSNARGAALERFAEVMDGAGFSGHKPAKFYNCEMCETKEMLKVVPKVPHPRGADEEPTRLRRGVRTYQMSTPGHYNYQMAFESDALSTYTDALGDAVPEGLTLQPATRITGRVGEPESGRSIQANQDRYLAEVERSIRERSVWETIRGGYTIGRVPPLGGNV